MVIEEISKFADFENCQLIFLLFQKIVVLLRPKNKSVV